MKKILHNSLYIWVLVADLLSNFGDMVYYLALLNYILMIPNSKLAFFNAGTFLIALLIMQYLTPAFQKLLAERPLKMAEQSSQKGQVPSLLSSLKIALDELKKVAEFRVLLVVGPAVNAGFSALTPLVILLMSEDSHFLLYNTATTLAAISLTIFLGTILGGLSVLYVFKKTSVVQLAVGAVVCLMGIYTGLLLHNLPLVLVCTTLTGIASGAVNPKFSAKLANSMPEEHLATISGGLSTYFMIGMSLVQLLVAGLVLILILSSQQLSLIFLLLSLGLLVYSLLIIRKWKVD